MISVKLTNLFTGLKKYTNQLQLYTKHAVIELDNYNEP